MWMGVGERVGWSGLGMVTEREGENGWITFGDRRQVDGVWLIG